MKRAVAAALVAVVSAGDAALKSDVTPIQKVVTLLQGMQQKGQKALEDEQVQFAAYQKFCESTSAEKKRALDEEARNIETFKADAEKAKADAARLLQEINGHLKDRNTSEADLAKAAKVREDEKKVYSATHKDYTESIIALNSAISKLEKGTTDKKTAALVQVVSLSAVPDADKLSLASMLEQGPGGYGAASGGVIKMLKELQEKFQEDRTKLESEEMTKQNSFELLAQGLKFQAVQAQKQGSEKSEFKAKKLQDQATAEGALAQEQSALAADTKYRNDLEKTCAAKAAEFKENQQLRGQELEAIKKAIEIISGASVAGVAKKAKLVQVRQASAFAQLRSYQRTAQAHVAEYLQAQASKLNNEMLASVAMSAAGDTFGKVKKMIQDLIGRLKEEESSEATHGAWCKKELGTNEKTRKDKATDVKSLTAEIEGLSALIKKSQQDSQELKEGISTLTKALANATDLRQKEKAKNEQTIKEAHDAQLAVAQAIKVLQDFYAKVGKKAALVQTAEEQTPPKVAEGPYKGQENGGVIGLLEVIQSDFSRLEAETKAAEANNQKAFEKLQADTKKDTAAKTEDINFTAKKIQQATAAVSTKTGDLQGSKKELKAAEDYFEKLKPSCVETGPSYEERVKQRQQEIDSLKDALQMLKAEAA